MHAYNDVLHAKDKRDPRGYIIPADQPDFLTAVKFVNTLRHVGVYVDQATAPFTVAGKQYPASSFVIKMNQAARAHVLDMMEPQDHPNDFAYPGGPPRRPYDNAGWTLAYEMGVKFDRVLDGVRRAEHEAIRGTELAKPPAGTVANAQRRGRLPDVARGERRGDGHQPRVQGGRRSVLAQVADAGERQDVAGRHVLRLRRRRSPTCYRSRPRTSASASSGVTVAPGRRDQDLGEAHRARTTSTAARCRPAGRVSSSRISRFRITIVYPKDLDAGNLKSQVRRHRSCRAARRFAARAARASVAVAAAVVVAAAAARRFRRSSRRCRAR